MHRFYSLAVFALACAAPPQRASPPLPEWHPRSPGERFASGETVLQAGPNVRHLQEGLGSTLDEDVFRRSYAVDERFPIGGTIEGASVNNDIGQDLVDFLDAQDPDLVAQYGVALLTPEELWGDGNSTASEGLCHDIELEWDFTEDSVQYEGNVAIWGFSFFTSDVEPYLWSFSDQTACAAALLDAGGDVPTALESGSCNYGHELSFFREGSDCRACVGEEAGDFGACVDAGRCEDTQQLVDGIAYNGLDVTVWFDVFYTSTPACAPGCSVLALLYANEKVDQTVPDAYDHEQWAHLCIPHWNDEAGGALFYCSGSTLPTYYDGEVRVQGVLGPTRYIREEGSEDLTWADRRFFASEITLKNGIEIFDGWAGNPGGGVLSTPPSYVDTNGDGEIGLGDENWGQQYIGYGLHPYTLRPDGSDPENLDDTFARDWVAASSLKTSTHTNGVPVHFTNHSRCAEWETYDGHSQCRTMNPPDEGWLNDASNWWFDLEHERAYVHTTATIASTGLPDPGVPGGIAVGIAASSTFADEDFEGCLGYPHVFEPDLVPFPDVPDVYDDQNSLMGDGWNFANPAIDGMGADIRVVLHTNWVRYHCPTDGG